MNFRVGDRVQVANRRDYPSARDEPCTVVQIGPPGPMEYFVQFDNPRLGAGSFAGDDLMPMPTD